MGVRTIYDRENGIAAIYDSVSGFAFGPTFTGYPATGLDADDDALGFLQFLAETHGVDPRQLTDSDMEDVLGRWRRALDCIGPTTSDLAVIVRLAVDYDTVATMRGRQTCFYLSHPNGCQCGVKATQVAP